VSLTEIRDRRSKLISELDENMKLTIILYR